MTEEKSFTGREDYVAFYRQHHQRVFKAMVVRAGGAIQVAADATQEAFIRAGERWDDGVSTHPAPVGWVYKTAQRLVDEDLRNLIRHTSLDGFDHPASAAVEVTVRCLLVVESINSLPERQRQVMTLHCMAGYSLVETAAILGIKDNTARSALRHAREEMRRRHEPRVPAVAKEGGAR